GALEVLRRSNLRCGVSATAAGYAALLPPYWLNAAIARRISTLDLEPAPATRAKFACDRRSRHARHRNPPAAFTGRTPAAPPSSDVERRGGGRVRGLDLGRLW